jgi:hypothetical protein
MVNDTTQPRTWVDYVPIHGLIISGLIAVIALGLWVIPAARAWFWFIPDGLSWSVFWLVAAILSSSAYYFVRTILASINSELFTLDRVRSIFVAILLYFAGAFILAKLRIAPPIETWILVNSTIITFFVLYTSFIVILVYLLQANVLEVNVLGWSFSGLSAINTVTIWRLVRILILFFVPAIILAKLGIGPANSDIATWFSGSELINTLLFFSVYSFSVLIAYMIGKPIVGLTEYLFRPVAPSEPSYHLYGPNIAWWIRLSIMFAIIAQFVCFFTAYFGLKLLLSEEGVTSIEVFSFHIPQTVLQTLRLSGEYIVWTQLQVISMVVAFILSAGISYFAAMAIQNLLEGHPVSFRLPILVVVLGLLSTYCGFTMWNGSAATAEELRHAIQTTKSLVDEFRDIDSKTLGAAADDASAQVSALERRVEQDERARLEARFYELNNEALVRESSYQALAAEAVSFDGDAAEFARMADNERLTGASSLVPGYGAVVRELQRISRAYKTAADSVSEIQKTHDAIKGEFSSLAGRAYSDIVKKAPLDILQKDLHAAQAKAGDFFNTDLRPVLQNLEAELGQPLPPVFSSVAGIQSAQTQALKSVKDNLANEADKISQIVAANPRKVQPAADGDPSSQSSAQIRAGTALVDDLAAFVKNIGDLNAARQHESSRIVEELDQGSEMISSDSKTGTLYFDRSGIVNAINKARSELTQLAIIDSDSLNNTLSKLNGEIADLDVKTSAINEYIKAIDTVRIAKLIPKSASYPKVEEFQLSPLALGVLKYFYLSLPLLLVQIFIDFGYTIGLIFGVSSMQRRSAGTPSDGVSFGSLSSTTGTLPPTAARIVSPTRASTKTR